MMSRPASGSAPIVIAVNGLDSRKEDLTESFSAILPFGVGFIAVDGPGTGQAPIKASENAERMFSRVLDYLQTRPEVDKTRIAVHGVSWGAYWASARRTSGPVSHRAVPSTGPTPWRCTAGRSPRLRKNVAMVAGPGQREGNSS